MYQLVLNVGCLTVSCNIFQKKLKF